MDFISKVSAKAEETFQSIKESEVTQKAKNYAGIPGLQIKVGKCEAAIKSVYQEIGEAYFKEHQEDAENPFKEQFDVIKQNLEAIGQLKAEIEEKKKGSEASADADAQITGKVCPICGRTVPEESAFCSICGHQF